MRTGQSILQTLNRMPGRFWRDRRGVSAVEFALLAPLMITLYFGAVELSQAISADRKVSLVSRSVADLVAQSTNVTTAEMNNILAAGAAVATPFQSSNLRIVVSSVNIDANKVAKVGWSDGYNTTARSVGQTVVLPDGILVANSSVIWAEVTYAYTPTIGYVITGTMNLTDQIYMRPRLQDPITRS
jgi:Flp pilus assembly protein TadG